MNVSESWVRRPISTIMVALSVALKALISIVAVGGISHTIYHTGTAQSFAWITDNIAWLLGGFSTLPPTTWAAVLFALSTPVFLVYRFRIFFYFCLSLFYLFYRFRNFFYYDFWSR